MINPRIAVSLEEWGATAFWQNEVPVRTVAITVSKEQGLHMISKSSPGGLDEKSYSRELSSSQEKSQ